MAKNKKPKGGGTAARNFWHMKDMEMTAAINKRIRWSTDMGFNLGYSRCGILAMWILHKEFGFGTKRLERFREIFNSFMHDYMENDEIEKQHGEWQGLSIYDIAQALKDECGIDIDPDTGMYKLEKPLMPGEEAEA